MKAVVFEGVWEELSAKHAGVLGGHRVEIRVLDDVGSPEVQRSPGDWAEFELHVREISKGWRLPTEQLYSAEDFYESRE